MANSVGNAQTAHDLGLHCMHMQICQTLRCSKFQDIHRLTIQNAPSEDSDQTERSDSSLGTCQYIWDQT